jgi:hypothetical protein
MDNPITPIEWHTLLTLRQHNKTTIPTTDEKTQKEPLPYSNPKNSKSTKITIDLTSQTPSKSTLENNNSSDDKLVELPFEDLLKEKIILKLASEGWYFRLKTVKNINYLCARKAQKEHSLGQYTTQIEHITQKHSIKIK